MFFFFVIIILKYIYICVCVWKRKMKIVSTHVVYMCTRWHSLFSQKFRWHWSCSNSRVSVFPKSIVKLSISTTKQDEKMKRWKVITLQRQQFRVNSYSFSHLRIICVFFLYDLIFIIFLIIFLYHDKYHHFIHLFEFIFKKNTWN